METAQLFAALNVIGLFVFAISGALTALLYIAVLLGLICCLGLCGRAMNFVHLETRKLTALHDLADFKARGPGLQSPPRPERGSLRLTRARERPRG